MNRRRSDRANKLGLLAAVLLSLGLILSGCAYAEGSDSRLIPLEELESELGDAFDDDGDDGQSVDFASLRFQRVGQRVYIAALRGFTRARTTSEPRAPPA